MGSRMPLLLSHEAPDITLKYRVLTLRKQNLALKIRGISQRRMDRVVGELAEMQIH